MLEVELKNGVVREYENGTTPADIAKSLGGGIFKSTCACVLNGQVKDIRTTLEADSKNTLELLTFDEEQGKKTFGIQHLTFWHRLSKNCIHKQELP